jgi:hypothetical protein
VSIEKQEPYVVGFTETLINSAEHHQNHLSTIENRAYSAIRARKKRKDPNHFEKIIIGWEDWNDLKPRMVDPNDIHFDEAKKNIGRLLFRVAKEPYNHEGTFNFLDLRASLDFQNFEGVLTSLKRRGYVSLYKDMQGRIKDDEWIVTDRGLEYFEKQVRDELEKKIITPTTNQYFHSIKLKIEEPFAFAVMPFKKEKGFNQSFWIQGYEKIIPEICSMKCYRSDGDTGPPKIGDKIWTMMQKAKFIVADVSSLNPNVLVELGMALALGKDVYLFSSKKLEKILFFDIKDFPVNRYLGLAGLQKKLAEVLPKK